MQFIHERPERLRFGNCRAAGGDCRLLPNAAVAAQKGTMRVAADYKIKYSGVKIGSFQFNSTVKGRRYHLTSSSRVKIFFGAFKWNSQSTTKGVLSRNPRPQSFDFNYQIKKKRKSTSVKFKRGNVVALEQFSACQLYQQICAAAAGASPGCSGSDDGDYAHDPGLRRQAVPSDGGDL